MNIVDARDVSIRNGVNACHCDIKTIDASAGRVVIRMHNTLIRELAGDEQGVASMIDHTSRLASYTISNFYSNLSKLIRVDVCILIGKP